ncbi:MAG: gsiA 4 [Frondihabitans sp.]|nr:gsiA 4 [Frondihabitans sp.]
MTDTLSSPTISFSEATDLPEGPVLRVSDLTISYRLKGGSRTAVKGASFDLAPGQVLALVGESGSGKTTTGHAILGLLPQNGSVSGGEIRYRGRDITRLQKVQLQELRGRSVSLIPQDPTVSLDPVRRVGRQVEDVLELHTALSAAERLEKVYDLFRLVGFTDVERRYRQYPHELSGGMRQRVLIAAAIACEPDVIIADEPTSGLDATVQAQVLDLIDTLRARTGMSMVLITHDLGVAADRSDVIAVMQGGAVVEQGATADVLRNPQHEYTRALLDSVPSRLVVTPRTKPATEPEAVPAIDVSGLVKEFGIPGSRDPFRAVDDVSFTVPAGSTLSIVGESGSGKSTTARILAHLLEPTSGSVSLFGTEVTALSAHAFRPLRQRLQVVYQNPYATFDPRWDVARVVEEPLRAFDSSRRRSASGSGRVARHDRVVQALDRAALPADFLHRHPRELSGGQRQRVAIARALVLEPEIVVLDEPISALDVSVQAQILELLGSLQEELGLTYVFISHDLAVVRAISDEVAVMKQGRILEQGAVQDVFSSPREEYTRHLLESIAGAGSLGR